MGELIVPEEVLEGVLTPREVLPNFFTINGNSFTEANGFALDTPDTLVAFDLGSDKFLKRTASHLDQISNGKKVILLATHHHADHIGGAMQAKEDRIIKEIWAPEPESDLTLRSQTASFLYDIYPEKARIDRYLKDEDILQFGDTTIEVIGTPGHTKNHISYLIHRPGHTPFMILGDLLGGVSDEIGSNRAEQVHSALKIKDIPFTHFVEGHGGINKAATHDYYDNMIQGIGEQLTPGFITLADQLRR